MSIHEYLTGEKWVRNSTGGNKKGAAKGDAAGDSSKGKAEARGCVASSLSFSGAAKHPGGWNGVSGGDWGLNGQFSPFGCDFLGPLLAAYPPHPWPWKIVQILPISAVFLPQGFDAEEVTSHVNPEPSCRVPRRDADMLARFLCNAQARMSCCARMGRTAMLMTWAMTMVMMSR